MSLASARLSRETEVSHCPLQSRTFAGRIAAVPGRSRRMTYFCSRPTLRTGFGARQAPFVTVAASSTLGDVSLKKMKDFRLRSPYSVHLAQRLERAKSKYQFVLTGSLLATKLGSFRSSAEASRLFRFASFPCCLRRIPSEFQACPERPAGDSTWSCLSGFERDVRPSAVRTRLRPG